MDIPNGPWKLTLIHLGLSGVETEVTNVECARLGQKSALSFSINLGVKLALFPAYEEGNTYL